MLIRFVSLIRVSTKTTISITACGNRITRINRGVSSIPFVTFGVIGKISTTNTIGMRVWVVRSWVVAVVVFGLLGPLVLQVSSALPVRLRLVRIAERVVSLGLGLEVRVVCAVLVVLVVPTVLVVFVVSVLVVVLVVVPVALRTSGTRSIRGIRRMRSNSSTSSISMNCRNGGIIVLTVRVGLLVSTALVEFALI